MMLTVTAEQPKTISYVGPTQQKDRISIIDSLRGFAILGILLMNIPSFGLPSPIGFDYTVRNETGINITTWWGVNLVFDGTQRALFSMLFGAGIILFFESVQKKAAGVQAADYFFRRQLWLLVFSLFDVFILLWNGDILLDYAIWGMALFTFRKLSAKKLLIAAGICLFFMLARETRDLYKDKETIFRGELVAAIDTTKQKLTPTQKEYLSGMQDLKNRGTMEAKKQRAEFALRRVGQGSYEQLYDYRTDRYVNQLVRYVFYELWDVLLFMFLGMAFFKMGILTGKAPTKVYLWMTVIGLGAGIFLTNLFLQEFIKSNFNWFNLVKNVRFHSYELGRTFRSVGLFGLIMLLYKSGLFKWLFALMRPVGQMAFSNYLMQSLICGIIFYSIGFGKFGEFERYQLYIVVASIWIFQIIFSHLWLRNFRFGPFEWAWRSLTYWRKQPMRKEKFSVEMIPEPVTS
jgi:uncharacterized protein